MGAVVDVFQYAKGETREFEGVVFPVDVAVVEVKGVAASFFEYEIFAVMLVEEVFAAL